MDTLEKNVLLRQNIFLLEIKDEILPISLLSSAPFYIQKPTVRTTVESARTPKSSRRVWICVCGTYTNLSCKTLSANKGQTGENMGNWMEFFFSSFEIGHACPTTYKPRCTGCQHARFAAVPLPVNLIVCKNIASYLLIRSSLHLS